MDKTLLIFFIFLGFAVGIYVINQQLYIQEEKQQLTIQENIYENQEYIITKIDNLSAERQEEQQKQTKELLANISELVSTNGELIKGIIEAQNITIEFEGDHPNASGSISSLGKPEIIR